jgi:hypothetical protein
MDEIRQGIERLIEVTFGWLPQLLGALVILIVGHLVAKAVGNVIRKGLVNVQFDTRLHASQGGSFIQRAVPNPTRVIVRVVYWLIFFGAITLAASVLGIDALNRFLAAVYGYVPQVIAAILIFLVGSAVAAGVATMVNNTMGDTPTGKIVETIAPVIVMGITIFMILDQLEIAPQIVTITYAAIVGSVALGSALAFGLGGRDVAGRMIESSYGKVQENTAQIKQDAKTGRDRAASKVSQARRRR